MHNKKHTQATKDKISDALKGNKHPQWKGGRIKTSNGYVWVHCPNNPMSNKCHPEGYVLEHRLVMSQKLGRYLTKDEVVHHINGIRNDNRVENLFLTQKGKHIAGHNHNRICKEETKQKHSDTANKIKRSKNGKFTK